MITINFNRDSFQIEGKPDKAGDSAATLVLIMLFMNFLDASFQAIAPFKFAEDKDNGKLYELRSTFDISGLVVYYVAERVLLDPEIMPFEIQAKLYLFDEWLDILLDANLSKEGDTVEQSFEFKTALLWKGEIDTLKKKIRG